MRSSTPSSLAVDASLDIFIPSEDGRVVLHLLRVKDPVAARVLGEAQAAVAAMVKLGCGLRFVEIEGVQAYPLEVGTVRAIDRPAPRGERGAMEPTVALKAMLWDLAGLEWNALLVALDELSPCDFPLLCVTPVGVLYGEHFWFEDAEMLEQVIAVAAVEPSAHGRIAGRAGRDAVLEPLLQRWQHYAFEIVLSDPNA